MSEQEPVEPSAEFKDWDGDYDSWVQATLDYARYWGKHEHTFVPCKDCIGCGQCYMCSKSEKHKIHKR